MIDLASASVAARNFIRIGSLFSGVGGLERGISAALDILGMETRASWQAEKDPYASAVLAKHWPQVYRYQDVRDVDEHAPPIDIICGGFPCQDLSIAGKRAGLDGARSGLWSEFVRVIRVLRPRIVFVENVPELLAHLGRVLGPLAALGYNAEWDVFSAAEVGAPHLRERLFILAHANGQRERYTVEPLGLAERDGAAGAGDDGGERHVAHPDGNRCEGRLESWGAAEVAATPRHVLADTMQSRRPWAEVAAHEGRSRPAIGGVWTLEQLSDAARRGWIGDNRSHSAGWWEAEPNVGRVVDGPSSRLDARRRRARLRCLGNGVVPAQACLAFLTLARRSGLAPHGEWQPQAPPKEGEGG